jgi:prevent-host-death family protein
MKMRETTTYTVTEARENFSEVISKAIYGGPVFIRRNKRERVAVVSAHLLDLLAHIEALIDTEKAQKALTEYETKGGVSLEQLKKELGM